MPIKKRKLTGFERPLLFTSVFALIQFKYGKKRKKIKTTACTPTGLAREVYSVHRIQVGHLSLGWIGTSLLSEYLYPTDVHTDSATFLGI